MTNIESHNEAIQCPFCGRNPKIISCMGAWAPDGYEPNGKRVVCSSMDCAIAGKPFFGDGDKEKAISWWNCRVDVGARAALSELEESK